MAQSDWLLRDLHTQLLFACPNTVYLAHSLYTVYQSLFNRSLFSLSSLSLSLYTGEAKPEMGVQTWSVTARPCDSCAAAAATVFCRADSAFLCVTCDGRVHAAHTRHPRVWVCEVCEQAPSAVTCKADAAALCAACDADIHSANPLARRHERVPVVPFYDAVPASAKSASADECSEEEAEAASWLLPDPNSKPDGDSGSTRYKSPEYLFGEMDPNLDLDLHKSSHFSSDGVVPVQDPNEYGSGHYPGPVANGFPAYDLDYPGSKPFMYNFTSQSICKSMSSSSLDVGVVPDDNVMADETKNGGVPTRASGVDREAKVLRYKEKRKNRIFGKTIRYTSRKVYAETRPRIKGRFAKRSEREVDSLVVPTF